MPKKQGVKQNHPQRRSPLLPTNDEFIIDYKNLRLAECKALTLIQIVSFNGKHQDTAKAIQPPRAVLLVARLSVVSSQ